MANNYMKLRCKNCGKEVLLAKNMRTDYSGFYASTTVEMIDKFVQEHSGDGECGDDFNNFPFELMVEA